MGTFRIEAEHLNLTNFVLDGGGPDFDFLSNQYVASLVDTDNPLKGYASTNFQGASGVYDITIGYQDENDGASEYVFSINPGPDTDGDGFPNTGVIDSWVADDPNETTQLPSAISARTHVISNQAIANGDIIEIAAQEDNNEPARFDYIEFVAKGNTPPPPIDNNNNGLIEIMPLGDSITRGEDAVTAVANTNGYRDNLQTALSNAGISFDFVGSRQHGILGTFDTDHDGFGGRKINEIIAKVDEIVVPSDTIDNLLTNAQPEIILLQIGTNDMRADDGLSPSDAIAQLGNLIDIITTRVPFSRLIVSSIPPVNLNTVDLSLSGVNSNFVNRVNTFNGLIPALITAKAALGKLVTFVDAFGTLDINQHISIDGFHPNESGYALSAGVFSNAIQNLLSTSANVIDGTPNNDTLNGTLNNDKIAGLAGDDVLIANIGDDLLNGNEGNDTLFGNDGNDTLFGNNGSDTLYGDNGSDTLYGGDANDFLNGGSGNDILEGGVGNDTLNGAADDDFLIGELGEDFLIGDIGNDTLFGNNGNDYLKGSDGLDSLQGGSGNDTLFGDNGNDTLNGGIDADILYGGDNDDSLNGGDDNDFLNGGAGSDMLSGDSGNDLLNGAADNDTLNGGSGEDTLFGEAGDDLLFGGENDDYLKGSSGNDTLNGENGNDIFFGDDGDDTLNGGDGIDTLYGGDNNDLINGGDGADYIKGSAGNDTLNGDAGNDSLFADGGNDSLFGGAGNDSLYGGLDDDILNGGDNNDLLVGGNGSDTLFGNDGNDSLNGDADSDMLNGGAGNDTLVGNDGDDSLFGGLDDDYLKGSDGNDSLFGDNGNDFSFGDNGDDSISGGAGNDTLYGDNDNDTLNGDEGSDFLNGGAGNDSLNGGMDNDTLNGAVGDDSLNGNAGDDTLIGDFGNDTLFGGDGNDYLKGSDGLDVLNGDNGDDVFFGDNGNDSLNGGDGNDTLYGGNDDDTINGNNGSDFLFGGAGNDTLTGGTLGASEDNQIDILTAGAGADRYIIESMYSGFGDNDYALIRGFDTNIDFIELDNGTYTLANTSSPLPAGVGIYGAGNELVAIVEGFNTDTFSLDAGYIGPPLALTTTAPSTIVQEGKTYVADININNVEDSRTVYSLNDGADKDLFKIDPQTGVLSFKTAPDWENPLDSGTGGATPGDNNYEVNILAVRDNEATGKFLTVNVMNVTDETTTAPTHSVYLMAGQSNLVGEAETANLTETPDGTPNTSYLTAFPQVQIWGVDNNGLPDFVDLESGFDGQTTTMGPELSFGRSIVTNGGNNVHLIKYGKGATSLAKDWNPNNTGEQYNTFVNTVDQALKTLAESEISYTLKGIVWQQGESDTYDDSFAPLYEDNLTNFIGRVRELYGSELEFAIGYIRSDLPTSPANRTLVRDAQQSVADNINIPLATLVDTSDGALNSTANELLRFPNDLTHYSANGQVALGNAFGNALLPL